MSDAFDNDAVLSLFRQTLEQLPVGVCLFDAQTHLLFCNTSLAEWLGADSTALVGRTWASLFAETPAVSPENPAHAHQALPTFLAGRNGERLAVDVSFAPLSTPGLTVATFWRHNSETPDPYAWFETLCAGSTAIKMLVDRDNARICEANAVACSFYGYSHAELCTLSLADLDAHPGVALDALLQQAAHTPAPVYRRQHRLRNGDLRNVDLFFGPAPMAERPGLLLVVHDVSRHQQQASETEQLALALAHTPIAVLIADAQGEILYRNRFAEQVLGRLHYAGHETFGLHDLVSAEQLQAMQAAFAEAVDWRGECRLETGGEARCFSLHVSCPPGSTTDRRLWVIEDITVQRQQEALIRQQANFDALTQLPNRVLAQDRLEQALRAAQRDGEKCALLYIDLDDFKKINDSLGHEAGDQVLVQAAQRLRQNVRDADTVARIGGDEFLIVLGNLLHPDDAIPAAEKLLRALSLPFEVEGNEMVVSASIGITICPDDGNDWRSLLQHADLAMYSAKNEGRATYRFFTRTMNLTTRRRLRVEQALRQALSREELEVFYQPVLSLTHGTLVGAEALLRWHNTALGDVSPGEFIPIAEQTGLINAMGDFALHSACKQFRAWQNSGLSLEKLAVNASPRQIRDGAFVPVIQSALRNTGMDPHHLHIEITESLLLNRQSDVKRQLSQLRELGLHLSMDDFGTGFSSLSYLKHFPFQSIKIDRAFIKDMDRDSDDRELVTAIVAMAKALRLQVVAEGVEKRAHLDLLGVLGCDFAQGFLIARPVNAEKFAQFARERMATLPLF